MAFLCNFSYPQAHEDDAERSVRAGLELVTAVSALKTPRNPANPCGHRDRAGGCRPSNWVGRFSGARNAKLPELLRKFLSATARRCLLQHRTKKQSTAFGVSGGSGPAGAPSL